MLQIIIVHLFYILSSTNEVKSPIPYFQTNLAPISHNVLGWRSWQPSYKANRRFAGAGNRVRQNTTKGVSPDWCFSNPEPPNRRATVTVCYRRRLFFII